MTGRQKGKMDQREEMNTQQKQKLKKRKKEGKIIIQVFSFALMSHYESPLDSNFI